MNILVQVEFLDSHKVNVDLVSCCTIVIIIYYYVAAVCHADISKKKIGSMAMDVSVF